MTRQTNSWSRGNALAGALLLCAALVLTGCAPPGTYKKVRNIVRSVVERDLGPADKYDVSTSRDSLSALRRGEISEVEVHGLNVRTNAGITLDEVFLTAHNVVVDRSAKRVKSARDASFTAFLGEAAIASLLAKTGMITNPSVEITAEGVSVRGTYAVGPAPMSVAATGGVRVASPTRVEFVPTSATVGGIPMPVAMITSRLSPSLDLSSIYKPLMIQDISLEKGRAILKGTIDWSKIP
jgi:hypothetical protein